MNKNKENERFDEMISKYKKVILSSLFNLAKGCIVKEKSEEFVIDVDGNICLKNRKFVKKQLAPDLQAIKVLMELKVKDNFEDMTDEELENEKQRLLEEIKNS